MASACGESRAANDHRFLRALVADLYFSEVDPALGAEALLLGHCGTLTNILTEMVARGGEESRDSVVAIARSVQGPGNERRIDVAAAAGLARHVGMPDTRSGTPREDVPAYGMLYFPSIGEGAKLDASMALNRLYEEAIPGYGIYTFVLPGRGVANPAGDVDARNREFFRVVETYVSTTEEDQGGPSPEAHVFLIPVDSRAMSGDLIDLVATDLSGLMRRDLGRYLRRNGHAALARRLEKGDGPFLVASLEPRLLPATPSAPRLLADLSLIGPEYIYGIVDAFDRPIAPEASGRPESLATIRERLLGLLSSRGAHRGDHSASEAPWFFMLGHFAGQRSGQRFIHVVDTFIRRDENSNA